VTWRMTLRLLRDQKMGLARGALETMASFEQRLEDAGRFLGLGDTMSAQRSLEAAEGHYCALANGAGDISAEHPYDGRIFGLYAEEPDWDVRALQQVVLKLRTRYERLLEIGFEVRRWNEVARAQWAMMENLRLARQGLDDLRLMAYLNPQEDGTDEEEEWFDEDDKKRIERMKRELGLTDEEEDNGSS